MDRERIREPRFPVVTCMFTTIRTRCDLGAIAEDQHLTRCAQLCFTGAEEDQAEQHNHGRIDEVL